jgi:hypothetical protein
MSPNPLLRLVKLPGVAVLEFKALMKPRMAEPDAAAEFPEIDACLTENFGLTLAEAEAVARPADWDRIDEAPIGEQVAAFEAAGWDVTDDKRKPLRLLPLLAPALWLAIRGVAGTLPFVPEVEEDKKPWGASLAADAAKFRKDRR